VSGPIPTNLPSRTLTLYEDYTRKDVHDVFDPDGPFAPQAGRWGIAGFVELPGRPGDFAFLVTFGSKQGDHQFDEGISPNGILRWQSQPRQDFADRHVQRWITHDAYRNVVHLFLRTAERRGGLILPYTYLGQLRYDGHDRERSRPVHLRWMLLDWPVPEAVRARMGLHLEDESGRSTPSERIIEAVPEPVPDIQNSLLEEAAPQATADLPTDGEPTRLFRAARRRRPTEAEARAVGLAGELLVLDRERRSLIAAGRRDLAEKVVHTAKIEGDGAGFDIRSFFADGRPKYVEVKTTTGPKDTDFLISANEVAFSAAHPNDFVLVRVFDFDANADQARCYSVFGDIAKWLRLSATQFRARV
jgi:Domain of unknown function (DUF3883)/Domain of unknown function (DUF3427)